ncbi:MAG: tetratricopeptide repeat protein [Acidobacteria bacterium]|nr:tetratricopeptide repeat protein [Acidobacteriota bacterium]
MADSQRIEDLRRRVQKDPASIAFAQLAEELRRAGQIDESIATCRAGLAIHPGYLSARVTLGRALIELDQLDDALAELAHVLASAPENLAAIRGVAEIHHRRGALPEALAQYRAALALARNDPDLQATVDDLARRVEPPKPAAAAEGLSLEQMTRELSRHVPPEPPPAGAAAPRPDAPAPIAIAPKPVEPETTAIGAPDAGIRQDAVGPPVPIPAAQPPDQLPTGSAAGEPPDPGRLRAEKTLAALEDWLDAIHATRTDRGA